MSVELVTSVTTLLKSFSSSAVTFATADNSIAATGIGTAFPAGKKINITGATNSGNNSTFTVVTATANKVIVTETVTAESAGAAIVVNEEAQSGFKQAFPYQDLIGTVIASQHCTVFLDFSDDKVNSFTVQIDANSGVTIPITPQPVLAHYVQLRVRNNGTDQTALRVQLNGRRRR